MSEENPPPSSDRIEATVGESAQNVIVGKDISSVSIGDVDGDIKDTIIAGRDVNITRLDPADARNQRNHKGMRQLVRSFWIDGVFKHSLYREVLIRLRIEERTEAVDNRPWDLILRQPGQPDSSLPPDTPIINVFDQVGRLLLILGEPGSGKTTMLLELTSELLERADNEPTHPSPVVFNLSSWAEKCGPITAWLVDELRTKYSIPKKVAQQWVENDELIPLLDGLDEVQPVHREACVTAINHFRQNHMTPLVVCSRITEYEELAIRLKLQSAIVLQLLSPEQIDRYLEQAGSDLATLGSALHWDSELQELATSPLMLSIMTMAYYGATADALDSTQVTGRRREDLFDAYIKRMLIHREMPTLYPIHQMIRWLRWLATQLVLHGQTIFLIERLQPSWDQPSRRFSAFPLVMLLWGLIYGLSIGPIFGLIFGPIYVLIEGLRGVELIYVLIGVLIQGLTVGVSVGLAVSLIEGLSGRYKIIQSIEQSGLLRRQIRSSLYAFFFWALSGVLIFGLFDGLKFDGLNMMGLFFGLIGALITRFRPRKLVTWPDLTWQKLRSNILFGLIDGMIVGLIFGFSIGLIFELFGGLRVRLIVELIGWLTFGLISGPIFGLISGLIFEPDTRNDVPGVKMTQIPNQGIKTSMKSSLSIGLSSVLVVALIGGLIGGLSGGVMNEGNWLFDMLNFGLIGGLIAGLMGRGDIVVKHMILRFMLWKNGFVPWNYTRFLDHCTARIFLRRVGGGYIFVHRLLMEHFKAMSDEDIERIAGSVG